MFKHTSNESLMRNSVTAWGAKLGFILKTEHLIKLKIKLKLMETDSSSSVQQIIDPAAVSSTNHSSQVTGRKIDLFLLLDVKINTLYMSSCSWWLYRTRLQTAHTQINTFNLWYFSTHHVSDVSGDERLFSWREQRRKSGEAEWCLRNRCVYYQGKTTCSVFWYDDVLCVLWCLHTNMRQSNKSCSQLTATAERLQNHR